MNVDEKYNLIINNLQEVVDSDKIKEILATRDLKVYIGTAPTGKPHLGYLLWVLKIGELLKAGCEVQMLFADLHAYLDNMKSNWNQLGSRTKFYELLIKNMLILADVPIEKLKFVKGTDFQLSKEYTLDMYKISALASTRDTKKAGAEVVKQMETPKMSCLIYPILQALDEVHLNVDAQMGGVDQRKIFMFAREFLPRIGYEKRIHLMFPLIPGLGQSGKMSSSEPNSKIDFTDSDNDIRKKINKAFSEDGVIQGNGLLAILKYIVFQFIKNQNRIFIIKRPEQYGGVIEFSSYEEVETAFLNKSLSSVDLKQGIIEEVIKIVTPLRNIIEENKELLEEAYSN